MRQFVNDFFIGRGINLNAKIQMKYLIQYSKWNGRDIEEINLTFDSEEKFLEEAHKYIKKNKFKTYVLGGYEFDEKFKYQQKISESIDKKFELTTELRKIENELKFEQRNFDTQKDILNEKGLEIYKNEINDYENKILKLENEIENLDIELKNMRKEIKIEELSKNLQKYLQRDLLCCNGCLPSECCCNDCENNSE